MRAAVSYSVSFWLILAAVNHISYLLCLNSSCTCRWLPRLLLPSNHISLMSVI